jgi:SAM-dependent methyltransferase
MSDRIFDADYFSKISKNDEKYSFLINLIIKYTTNGNERRTVLDWGCGEGNFAKRLSLESWVDFVCGSDISKYACEISSKRGTAAVLFNGKNLPFKDKAFDLVIMREVYEHIAFGDKLNALLEIRRTLKNQGHLVITTPNMWDITRLISRLEGKMWYGFEDKTHIGLTTPLGLKRYLKKANFSIIFLSSTGLELPSLGKRFYLIDSILNKFIIPRYTLSGLIAIARKE